FSVLSVLGVSITFIMSLHDALPICGVVGAVRGEHAIHPLAHHRLGLLGQLHEIVGRGVLGGGEAGATAEHVDVEQRVGAEAVGAARKSTRLNSSHVSMSYAVLCWKQ